MSSVTIRGIPVKFPFSPYDIQKDYMTKVIECIDTSANGVLESPTGTGKTLSLLCASLAWLERRKKEVQDQQTQLFKDTNGESEDASVPKIIYASRTHTQLMQVMQEMKKTKYSHMRACILGSREKLCFDEEVKGERNAWLKANMCRSKIKKKQCSYFNNIKKEKNNESLSNKAIVDIEDIVTLGSTHDFCPYYMARELKNEADVVFMPYNYLLVPKLSKSMVDIFIDNIVIFDEAHNIEKVCEDSVSVEIKTTDIQCAIDDVTSVLNLITNGTDIDVDEIPFSPEKLRMLISILIDFKKQVDDTQLVPLAQEGTVFDGDHIFTILEKSKIVAKNHNGIIDLLETIMDFMGSTKHIQTSGLQLVKSLLNIVFYKNAPEFRQKIKECFKVQINSERIERSHQSGGENCRVLSFWCFCPGFGMGMLMDRNVRCVILTSGTLAPLKPLISELELDVGVRIENPHIVKGDQICVKVLSKGPDSEPLICNYQNRDNPKYLRSLGEVIMKLVPDIPHGVLIFFPSYPIMQNCQQFWQESEIWNTINQTKPIFVEPKDEKTFAVAMSEYYAKINDPVVKGAVFMGVCRGKVSEGLDFADINGRAVFIVGLPYPPLKDPKIILKKRYLDVCNSKNKEYLRGDEWYSLEATRAINQAIGRVIRHKNDYGAIILLDSKFANSRVQKNLSLWLRKHVQIMQNIETTINDLRLFFQNATTKVAPINPRITNENLPPNEIKPRSGNFDSSTSSISLPSSSGGLVNIHKRKPDSLLKAPKKTKITVVANRTTETSLDDAVTDFISLV